MDWNRKIDHGLIRKTLEFITKNGRIILNFIFGLGNVIDYFFIHGEKLLDRFVF